MRGRPPKRDQTLAAARQVFGRIGYAGATMEGIAAEADVSIRTIYQHFPSKHELFVAALCSSAALVAEDFAHGVALMGTGEGPEQTLTGLARAVVGHRSRHQEHFALLNQLHAQAVVLTDQELTVWREAGPVRVRNSVAGCLAGLHRTGFLAGDDLDLMTAHFLALVYADQYRAGVDYPMRHSTGSDIDSGVCAFLCVYGTGDDPAVD